MITAIVIPANPDQPVRQQHIEKSDLSAYQQIVGGHLEVLTFDRPPASMYINEAGKLNRMRLNHRATTLMWVHSSAFRERDVIAGPAFIVGRPDRHGDDKSVPDGLLALLLNTKRYRVQLQTRSDARWSSDNQVFTDWFDAYLYSVQLTQSWPQITEVRVRSTDGQWASLIVAEVSCATQGAMSHRVGSRPATSSSAAVTFQLNSPDQ
jgi:hypothetical protein